MKPYNSVFGSYNGYIGGVGAMGFAQFKGNAAMKKPRDLFAEFKNVSFKDSS